MSLIREHRDAMRMTQEQLAKKIGLSTMTIARYEAGSREPRATELKKMAEIFGCTIDDLVNPTPPPAGSEVPQEGRKTV